MAAYDYAANQYSRAANDILLAVEVSPEDVVSIPFDYNNQKIRCAGYRVIGPIAEEFKEKAWSEDRGFYNEDYEDDAEYVSIA